MSPIRRLRAAGWLLAALWLAAAPAAAQPSEGSLSLACSRQLFVAAYPTYLAFRVHGPIDACMADQFASLADQLLDGSGDRLTLRLLIHSEGGSLSDALAMVGAIQRVQQAGVRVVAVADGVVGGAAVFVWAAGDARLAAPLALFALSPRPVESKEPGWLERLLLIRRAADPLAGWWRAALEWLAGRLHEPVPELQRLMERRAHLTGDDVVRRGWATQPPAGAAPAK